MPFIHNDIDNNPGVVPMLRLRGLSVGHAPGRGLGGRRAAKALLTGVDLAADGGSLVALAGANGTGKSTLLATVMGLLPPLAGQVLLRGRDIRRTPRAERARLVSYAGASRDINPSITVGDLVALGRYPYTSATGRLSAADTDVVERALADTRTAHLRGRRVGQISDGERQRALIARSLAQDTPAIVLDEPTAFLDMANKFEMSALLSRLARGRGKLVLFSSHDLPAFLGLADRLWLIDNGRVLDGVPEEMALGGLLGRMVSGSGVEYDVARNEFRYPLPTPRAVTLAGDAAARYWAAKALARAGVADLPGQPVVVEGAAAHGGGFRWTVSRHGVAARCFDGMAAMIADVAAGEGKGQGSAEG